MALLKAVTSCFERISPLKLAGTWDNAGIILNVSSQTKSDQQTVLLCIDLTHEVLESKPPNTGVIVAYHPPIFGGLKSLNEQTTLQNNLLQCVRHNISVFSPHSALDGCVGGINDFLASGLGQGSSERLSPNPSVKSGMQGEYGAGTGLVHTLDEAISADTLVQRVKTHLKLKTVMLARAKGPRPIHEIKSIAICAGAGGSMLADVDCDAWLTGEASHHEILAAVAAGRNVVLCNHTNNERPYLSTLAQMLQQALDEYRSDTKHHGLEAAPTVVISQADADPLEFV